MSASPKQASQHTLAAAIPRFGDPELFELIQLPLPDLEPSQVRLRVLAASVNPTDLGTREGRVIPATHAAFPMVLGWDAAGIVEGVGADVSDWRVGDRAIALVRQPFAGRGTYAQHVIADAGWLAPYPTGQDAANAAALPLAGLTARQAIDALALSSGERLLVNGPLGAVGGLATQLAVHAGAQVIGVVDAERVEEAHALGIDETVNRTDNGLVTTPGGGPVDAALDVTGGATAVASFAAVRDGGRYVSVVPQWWIPGGPFVPDRGVVPRVIEAENNAEQLAELSQLLASGQLALTVAHTLPLDQAAQAHRISYGRRCGKVVLIP